MVSGTQSTIHGDLNLENALVVPGDFIWLIDFAMTRDGHTLFDFAHLEAEIIAQVIAPQLGSPQDYLDLLQKGRGSPVSLSSMPCWQRCARSPAAAYSTLSQLARTRWQLI